jgi:acyl-CoA thioesterase
MTPADDQATRGRRFAQAMFDADTASRHLGIEADRIEPGRATARMTIADTMVNGHAMAHGGYVFLLADTAFALACNAYGQVTVARACDIVFVRPARAGDELVATAVERLRAGRSGIYDVTVRRADGDVIAELRGHSATVADREEA